MPYDFLETLRDRPLPLDVSGEDVHIIKAYETAGLIKADICDMQRQNARNSCLYARITSITPLGRKILEKVNAQKSLKQFKLRI